MNYATLYLKKLHKDSILDNNEQTSKSELKQIFFVKFSGDTKNKFL